MNSCKSPSKYLSLEFLKELQVDHYISKGGIEYESSEVNDLILEKQESAAMKLLNEMNDYLEEQEIEEIPFPKDEDFHVVLIELLPLKSTFNNLIRKVKSMVQRKKTSIYMKTERNGKEIVYTCKPGRKMVSEEARRQKVCVTMCPKFLAIAKRSGIGLSKFLKILTDQYVKRKGVNYDPSGPD